MPGAAVPGELFKRLVCTWPGSVHLIAGPLYHINGFWCSYGGLFEDQTLVVMERFDAARVLDLIERYRVEESCLVPTMLNRIARLPDVARRDFSSIKGISASGSMLPPWVMRAWIELLGPERMWEIYGATEGHGSTLIRGDEWLEHPGSVGRPLWTEVRIVNEDGREVPAGEVGEIFMRYPGVKTPTFEYVGATPRTTPEGFASVGDLGWVDRDGYLYIADRRADMIISGGANIYPAEVETALSEHPEVVDVAVIGIPDEDWGKRVHAIIRATHARLASNSGGSRSALPGAARSLQGAEVIRVRRRSSPARQRQAAPLGARCPTCHRAWRSAHRTGSPDGLTFRVRAAVAPAMPASIE